MKCAFFILLTAMQIGCAPQPDNESQRFERCLYKSSGQSSYQLDAAAIEACRKAAQQTQGGE